jgi:hypothetical protein
MTHLKMAFSGYRFFMLFHRFFIRGVRECGT